MYSLNNKFLYIKQQQTSHRNSLQTNSLQTKYHTTTSVYLNSQLTTYTSYTFNPNETHLMFRFISASNSGLIPVY